MSQCRRCGGVMQTGAALQNRLHGYPDFPGSREVCTVSRTGPPRLVWVLKCASCGYSVTLGADLDNPLPRSTG